MEKIGKKIGLVHVYYDNTIHHIPTYYIACDTTRVQISSTYNIRQNILLKFDFSIKKSISHYSSDELQIAL